MRRILVAALALAALAVALPAPASAASHCGAKGSETVRKTHKVRVYWTKNYVLRGCVRATGVTRTLYRPPDHPVPNEIDSVTKIRVAGYWVAWVSSYLCTVCGDGPYTTIRTVELRSNERHLLSPARKAPERRGTRVDALVLDRCGRFAYRAVLTGTYGAKTDDPDPRLYGWAAGTRHDLDRGAIVRDSIRLRHRSVRWRRDGEDRSAPLTPAC